MYRTPLNESEIHDAIERDTYKQIIIDAPHDIVVSHYFASAHEGWHSMWVDKKKALSGPFTNPDANRISHPILSAAHTIFKAAAFLTCVSAGVAALTTLGGAGILTLMGMAAADAVSMGAVTSLLTTSLALMTIQRAGGIAGFVKGQDEAHKIYHAVIKPTLDDLGMDTMTPHKDFLSNNRFSDVAYPRVIADLDNLSRDDLEIMARDITIDQDTQYQWARQNNKFWQTTPTVDADGIWSKKRDAFEANVETAIKHRLSSGRGFVGGLRALGFSPS